MFIQNYWTFDIDAREIKDELTPSFEIKTLFL